VFSVRVDVPVLARQALKRSSHGPLATRFGWKLTREGPAEATDRRAMASAPVSRTTRRRIAGELSGSTLKACLEMVFTPA
jgi:hypothetical protein